MSILRCDIHGHWDSDDYEECPVCTEIKALNEVEIDKLKERAESAEARVRELMGHLEEYGMHKLGECAHMKHSAWACDCGFDAALQSDERKES